MTTRLQIIRAGPLTSIQDDGRFGMLRHGVSASGPMDRTSYLEAGQWVEAGQGGVEFTIAGLELTVLHGSCGVGFAGGEFTIRHNGEALGWPGRVELGAGDTLAITPGLTGNYGYLRFNAELEIPTVLGSMSTNSRAGLGGLTGKALQAGDILELGEALGHLGTSEPVEQQVDSAPIRVIWGAHADLFTGRVRQRFLSSAFAITPRMDRMGVRLHDTTGVFSGASDLSLVSEAIVPGDIQILGDGTPIVLMRDHQPTGGYPRIATVITADLDRFAQLRPGTEVRFQSVTVARAHHMLRGRAG